MGTSESLASKNELLDDGSSGLREKKLASLAMSEVLKEKTAPGAVEIVHDHFPEDISSKEYYEKEVGPNPFQTEEDYRQGFDLFLQEELVPKSRSGRDGGYSFELTYRPYGETVQEYKDLAIKTVKDLTGESGKLPKTDVAIYLDKSARPVSWLVEEFWDDATKMPRPRTEYLAIDRKFWFEFFGLDLSFGEYIKGTDRLAEWRDLPIHNVTQDEMTELRSLLKEKIITHEELDACLKGDVRMRDRVKGRVIDTYLSSEENSEKIKRGEMTRKEFEACKAAALEKVKVLDSSKLESINDARVIAERLRGLFVPGGLSEEDLENSEQIMDYSVGMEGKNITIVDEVSRTGATGEIAKHFITWAFPEAANVNFYTFYDAKRLHAPGSAQDGQMLKIPFWYSLEHDDGTGRGISGADQGFYERRYKESPDDLRRAACFGWDFLGVPIDYETEKGKKSLKLREQIARLRKEYEKGHI